MPARSPHRFRWGKHESRTQRTVRRLKQRDHLQSPRARRDRRRCTCCRRCAEHRASAQPGTSSERCGAAKERTSRKGWHPWVRLCHISSPPPSLADPLDHTSCVPSAVPRFEQRICRTINVSASAEPALRCRAVNALRRLEARVKDRGIRDGHRSYSEGSSRARSDCLFVPADLAVGEGRAKRGPAVEHAASVPTAGKQSCSRQH